MTKQLAWLGMALGAGLLLAAAAGAAEKAPDATLQTLDGKTFKLAEVLGKKTVVLNFWAAWCESCKEELPQLADFQKLGKPDVVFLGINAGESAAKAKKFQERYHYPYMVLLDTDKSAAKLYGVTGVPQTIVIGKKGMVLFRGSRPPKEFPQE
jgi:peroxiredoxin